MKNFLLLIVAVFLIATSAWAQNNYLNELFNTDPVLSATNENGKWYVDRYAPASFDSEVLGIENVLRIHISPADGAQSRPSSYSGGFYNTQGRKFNQDGLNATILKGDLYLPADWATQHRRSDMWATAFNATNSPSFYPIIGFRNPNGLTPSFSCWNGTGWDVISTPTTYDTWYSFEIRLSGGNILYFINGTQVKSFGANGSAYFGNVIMQAYNFNDNTLGASYDATTNEYDAYWDNIICQSNVKNVTQSTYYPTVQTAVIASTAGDVIEVAAGSYEFTSQMNIDKPGISITGQGNVIFQANNPSWSTTNGYKHLIGIYAGTVVNPVTISNIVMNCNSQCYGVNTYNNANSILNAVTINGSKGAGLTVNGSTVSATNLYTGTNAWGAVNVDPGSGVTTPSIFTLNGGTLAENTQIWSDGSHVNGSATVTVNATGYNKYNVGTTKIWTNRALTNCATITKSGETTIYFTIQAAIDGATAGDVIDVYPGNYYETALNRAVFGIASYQFGLFIDKNNLTIRGVKADGSVITNYSDVATLITTNSTANFGPSGIFVQANNVTLQGLGIGDNIVNNLVSSNKTIEVVGDAFTMHKCVVNTSSDQGAFYMGRWDASHPIESYNISDNLFNNTLVSINNGVGITGPVGSRLITGNAFTGVATPYIIGFRGWNGASPAQGWIVDPVGGAIVTGNTFNNTGVDKYIVARGNAGGYVNSELNWNNIWNLNTYGNKVISLETESPFAVRSYNDGTYPETRKISPVIQDNITNIAQSGDVILVGDGTYNENLTIGKNITLLSVNGAAASILDGNNSGSELGAIQITTGINGVTIGSVGHGFTVKGINGNGAIEKAAIYLQGTQNNINIVGNIIEARGDAGLQGEYNAINTNILIDNNEFTGQTFTGSNPGGVGFATQFDAGNNCPRQLVVFGGGAGTTNTLNFTFTNNTISGISGGMSITNDAGGAISPAAQGNTMVTLDLLGTNTITGNTWSGTTTRYAEALRVRGNGTYTINNNSFSGSFPKFITRSSGATANATCNWYGTTDATTFAARIEGNLNWSPFLSTSDIVTPVCTGVAPIRNVTKNLPYVTISSAVTAASANDVITVAAGTYAENIAVNKALDIRGPNYNISPNSGTRVAEAIVVSGTSSVGGEIFMIQANTSNVKINGFTIDGDNPLLTSGYIGTNGADIDAAEAVTVYFAGVNNLTVSNNILQNLGYAAVTLFGGSYSDANTSKSGNVISNNLIRNLGYYNTGNGQDNWGIGVLLYNSHYASIIDNVMTNVRIGIQTGNFQALHTGDPQYQVINNNSIQTRYVGVFYNLHRYSPWTISNNTITGIDNAVQAGLTTKPWRGMLLGSLGNNMGSSTLSNNTIDGSGITLYTTGKEGINVWNVHNNSAANISGGSISGVSTGIFLNNYEGYNTAADDGANANINSVNINAIQTGIRLLDSPNSTSHIAVQATVTGCTIANGVDGILLNETTTAKVSCTATGNSITGQSGKAINSSVSNVAAATCNWYGTAIASEVAAKINGNVTYVPYKVSNDGACEGGPVVITRSGNFVSAHTTIQTAINASQTGDVITVAEGTYVEAGQIAVNKNLTITGANAATTIIKPNSNTTSGGNVSSEAFIYIAPSTTVSLNNFTVDCNGKQVHHAIQSRGDLTVDNCIVQNVKYGAFYGRGIVLFKGNNTIKNTSFTNIERIGIHVRGNVETPNPVATIQNITYTGKGTGNWLDYAVEFGGGGTGTVENLNASDCKGTASNDGSTSAGVLVTDYWGTGTNATISNSTLTNNTTGIAVGYAAIDASTVVAHNNKIYGNTSFGISSTGVLVNATSNYWGGCPSVDGNVSYFPYYTTGTFGTFGGDISNINAEATVSTICAGSSTTVYATGGSDYSWDNGLGLGSSKVVSPIVNTTYNVTGKDANGCAGAFDAYTLAVTPAPVVLINGSADGTSTIPAAEQVVLTASGATDYLWSTDEITPSINVLYPTATTTYSVTGTTGLCSASATHTVTPIIISAGPNQFICNGSSTSLTATVTGAVPTEYLWSPGGATTQTISVNPSSTEEYEVTVTFEGSTASAGVTVFVNSKPLANVGSDITIAPASSGTLISNPSAGTAPYAYAWSGLGIIGASNTKNITVNSAGTYSLIVTDAFGCVSTSEDAIVTIADGYTVSGNVSYFNNLNPQMHNVTITLTKTNTPELGKTYTAVTPASGMGNYQFPGVINGNYSVSFSLPTAWGGVTSSDIIAIQNHYKTVNPTYLVGLKRLAADVYLNSTLATIDALDRNAVNNKRLYPNNPVYNFATGNWVFTTLENANLGAACDLSKYANSAGTSNLTITVNAGAVTQNFKSLCYGDVDASYSGYKTLEEDGTLVEVDDINGLEFKNYPNPFVQNTTLSYVLPVEGNVSIDIYNLLGSRVAHIEKGVQTEGEYTIQWNARNNATGIYVAMITVKTSDDILRQQVKMIIQR